MSKYVDKRFTTLFCRILVLVCVTLVVLAQPFGYYASSESGSESGFEDVAQAVLPSATPEAEAFETLDTNAGESDDPFAPSPTPIMATGKKIALTFDDGPSKFTEEILSALRAVGGRATFCVVGVNIEGKEQVLIDAVEQGSEVVGHSWNHWNLTKLSEASVKREISKTADLIKEITGVETHLYRPPFGNHNAVVRRISKSLDMTLLMWSIDTEDWKYKNEQRLYDYVLKNVKEGSIILCHDVYQSTMLAAVRFIPELVARGYELVTATELLEYQHDGVVKRGVAYTGKR